MWTCKDCKLEIEFDSVAPEIDKKGLHFICPFCNFRNKLINIGNEHMDLVQPDIDWDKFKSKT